MVISVEIKLIIIMKYQDGSVRSLKEALMYSLTIGIIFVVGFFLAIPSFITLIIGITLHIGDVILFRSSLFIGVLILSEILYLFILSCIFKFSNESLVHIFATFLSMFIFLGSGIFFGNILVLLSDNNPKIVGIAALLYLVQGISVIFLSRYWDLQTILDLGNI